MRQRNDLGPGIASEGGSANPCSHSERHADAPGPRATCTCTPVDHYWPSCEDDCPIHGVES